MQSLLSFDFRGGMLCIYCFSSLFGPALFFILNTVIADISVFHFSRNLQDAMLPLLTPQVFAKPHLYLTENTHHLCYKDQSHKLM